MRTLVILIFSVSLIVFHSFSASGGREEAKPPNILFCLADDASLAHFGTYGASWVNTPNIDDIARKGVKFMNAYTPNAKCAPSRATILTGRNFWQLEEAGNHLNFFQDKFRTITELLDEAGYLVGYTGKGWGPSRTSVIDGKPRDMLIKRYNDKTLTPPASGISNTDYTENFRVFLSERDESQPFFFWYGCREPHRVYEFGSGIKHGDKSIDQIDEVYKFWPDTDTVRIDMLDYAFEIEHFDRHLGNMVRILEEMGELEHTMIVVTSDNGMPFPRIKGQVYEYSNHLPLVIMWPDGIRKPGRIIDDMVNFADFAPTFAEVAGIDAEMNGMQPISGKSLTDILFSEIDGLVNPERDHIIVGKERHDLGRPFNQGYPVRGIVKDGFLYLINFKIDRWPVGNPETGYSNTDNSPTKSYILNTLRIHNDTTFWSLNFGKRPDEELYNIVKDPECMINLALDSEFMEIKASMRDQLLKELTETGDPRMHGEGDVFDNYLPFRGGADAYHDIIQSTGIKKICGELSNYEKQLVEIKCPAQEIAPPANLIATEITHESVHLVWDPSPDSNRVDHSEVIMGSKVIDTTSNTSLMVTGLIPNVYYVFSIKAVDADGNRSAKSNSVGITTLENPLDISEWKDGSLNPVEVYPVPSSERLFIESKRIVRPAPQLFIYDSNGRFIYKYYVSNELTEVDLTGYPKGLYMLEYRQGNTRFQQKIIRH